MQDSVGPGARRLLHNYWRRLTMAARAGGYCGTDFKGERGVTQGDQLPPTLFNVVVDAVVWHWLEGLQAEKDEKEAEEGEGHFSAVFYADDRMVGATDPQLDRGDR